MIPAIIDSFGYVFDEVYIYRGKIIDRGNSICIPNKPETTFGSAYLNSNFDGEITEAKFVYLNPISIETGKPLKVKTPALHLRIKVLDALKPRIVEAFYTIDYESAPNATILLPTHIYHSKH